MAFKSRILVVDDEEQNRDVLSRRLRRAGFEVTQAADGPSALELLGKQPIDLIMLDTMMPGMSGLEVLQQVRIWQSQSELPVIMATALAGSEHVVEALDLGANDYVTKPIDFPVALARIHSQLTRKHAEDALRESQERYALAARGSNDGIWDWDMVNNTVYYSPRWREIVGCGEGDFSTGLNEWISRVHPDDRVRVVAKLEEYRHLNGPVDLALEQRMIHKDGGYRWMLVRAVTRRDATGNALRMAGSQTDVTQNRAFDALTGLANRVLFTEVLTRRLALEHEAVRNGTPGGSGGMFAVLFLDLDRFKIVNDSLGHEAGDALLVEVGRRLTEAVRGNSWDASDDLVARLGGDEFAVLLSWVSTQETAELVADRILKVLSAPLRVQERELTIGASIGIAMCDRNYQTGAEMLRDADTALYRAKALGRSRSVTFGLELRAQAIRRLEIETDLRLALEQNQLLVYYQPKVDLAADKLVGFEALVRWRHPVRGIVSPNEFIPIAEESDLIVPIGFWVLRESCRALKAWQQKYSWSPPLLVSVNLSVRQFVLPDLTERIKAILDETGLAASSLKLEITESVLIEDLTDAARIFAALKALGIQLKIDDFGTGYSSLSYLSQLPFDSLKIDRSFLAKMCDDPQALGMVKTIIELGRNMGMEVIAEGIENECQLAQLKELGCAYGQGYYFSAPIPEDAAEEMIRKGASQIGC